MSEEKQVESTEELSQLEKDQKWLDEVYQGDAPQLTVRALVTGLLLGWLMALSNLYVGLKSGWGLGVEITAIVLAFAIWKVIEGMRLTKRPLGMMENLIVMTSAVAPSYITSAGLVSSIPAIWMLDPDFTIAWWQLGIWMMTILFLGLMVAIPIKRQVVNSGDLRFPAVVPAAETLKSMYSKGDEAMKKASSLGVAGVLGVITKVLSEKAIIPALLTVQKAKIAGIGVAKLTLFFETSWIFIGFGAFIGTRVGVTMIVGMILNFAVLAPWMIHNKEIKHAAPEIVATDFIEFPVTIPGGSALSIEIEEAVNGPELEAGTEEFTYTKTWNDTTTYNNYEELLAEMNSQGDNNGQRTFIEFYAKEVGVTVDKETYKPVPFLPFEMEKPIIEKRNELRLHAPEMIYWEAKMSIVEPFAKENAAPFLNILPEASNTQTVGSYRNIVAWTMWPGVGMMVVAGLLSFAFQWKTVGRAFGQMFSSIGKKQDDSDDDDPVSKIEIPMIWFLIGFTVFGILSIILMKWLFAIPIWMGIIAVIMSFFLAVVSVRVSGETGIIPIGAMGKVTQLTFGVLHPGSMKTNLMTAAVTSGAATSASDMTNQFKVGHMVGAKARLQFIAQCFGIVSALAVIPVFFIMVPDSSAIGTQELPAPAAIVWAGVARLLSQGIGSLPPTAVAALIIASIFGIAITVLERYYPKCKSWWWLPSPAAMGIAMTVPALYSISMFLGAMIAAILAKTIKKTHEMFTIPVASGFIAGESLTGVFFAILSALGG